MADKPEEAVADETTEQAVADEAVAAMEGPVETPKVKKPRRKAPADMWANKDRGIPVGAKGPTVAKLRERFGLPDGDRFDHALMSAVREFQLRRGIAPTGAVSLETRRALEI